MVNTVVLTDGPDSWSGDRPTYEYASGSGLQSATITPVYIDLQDSVEGREGKDVLYGNVGRDTIYGGDGNDTINGGPGADSILGDAGNDVITGGAASVFGAWVNSTATNPNIWDNDYEFADEGDSIYGGEGNDTISGGPATDWLNGQWGNDVVKGDAGNDVLIGEDGNDSLDGGAGNDYFLAGKGGDWITGGGGNDTITLDDVVHSSKAYGFDKIYGFDNPGGPEGNGDVIDLQFIDPFPNQAGDQAFEFVGLLTAATSAQQQKWGNVWIFDHSWDDSTMVQGWIEGGWFQFWIFDGPDVHARDYTEEDFVL